MKPVKIYILVDPRDNAIRYVGKTTQKLSTRLSAHLRENSKCHRCNWIKNLKACDLKPRIVVLEELCGEWPWQEAEKFWIKFLKLNGHNLTNNTSGGDGVPDLPKETREIITSAWRGRKHSKETIEKLKHCRKNFHHTEATKKKMSKAHKGREIKWVDKIAKKLQKLTNDDIVTIKARLEKGEKVCNLAKEYNVHRTTLSKIKMGTYLTRGQKS